jgi:1,4-alpha-glucan branching enzyme
MVTTKRGGRVEFRLHQPQAHEVLLIGHFAQPTAYVLPMNRESNGDWVCSLRLAEGVYDFGYEVDGRRYVDCAGLGGQPAIVECSSLLVRPASDGAALPLG